MSAVMSFNRHAATVKDTALTHLLGANFCSPRQGLLKFQGAQVAICFIFCFLKVKVQIFTTEDPSSLASSVFFLD